MSIKDVFKMPKTVKITGRTSSITNSFVNGIIPVIEPNEKEIQKALEILGMNEDKITCAYCGDTCTEWDHFRPLVKGKKPTGYISEIHNLVPSCSKCNQSKGNQNWKEWMLSDAVLSPKTKQVRDLEEKIKRLERYESWGTPVKVDFEKIVGKYKWEQHWENCLKIHKIMQDSQELSDEIQAIVVSALKSETIEIKDCFREETSVNQKVEMIKNTSVKLEPSKIELTYANVSVIKNYTGRSVGLIVQNELKDILQSGKLSDDIIGWLQSESYSKQIFDMNFAILKKIDTSKNLKEQSLDHLGYSRYYAKPITIKDIKYLLTSQWYDRNKPYLIRWLESI